MNALVFQAVGQPLLPVDRPSPRPAAGEAVVRLRAAALNRRDYWITQGQYPGLRGGTVLGSDGAGVVSELGEGVDPGWRGREVVINPGLGWGDDPSAQAESFQILGMPRDGTFAAEVVVPAAQLHPKPAHLTWPQAAALPLAGVTAWRALFAQGGLKPGESVLITGIGGGVASLALQFAVAAGAPARVTSSSPEKIRRAVELGAAGGYDYRDAGWAKRLPAPPALIVDGAGGPGYGALLQAAARGGRIVSYGATAGAPEKIELAKVFWKQLRLQGSTMGSPADFAAMLAFVERHRIAPVVDAVHPLAEGPGVVERMARSEQFGKVVLEIP